MHVASPLLRAALPATGRLSLCVISAAMVAAAFPPVNLQFLMWVGLLPLLLALEGLSPRDCAAHAGVFGFVLFALTVHWLWNLFGVFSASLFVIFALSYALFGWLYGQARQRLTPAAVVLLTPTLWVGAEYLRAECWALRFGWGALGYSQADTAVMQLASVVGVYGVTWLLVLVNALLYFTVTLPADRSVRLCWLAGSLLVGGIKLSESLWRKRSERRIERLLRAACVQGEEVAPEQYEEAAATLGHVELMVLPEYALHDDPAWDIASAEVFSRIARRHRAYLLYGCLRHTTPQQAQFFNTALMLSPDGNPAGEYRKRNPLPFFNDGLPGHGSQPITTSIGRIGVAVCFDGDFEKPCREVTAHGAQLLAIPTFDSRTWGDAMRRQHEAFPRFRAVETGMYVVRAASSGYSMVVDPKGRVLARARTTEPEAIQARVGLREDLTWYVRWGWLWPRVCLAVSGLLAAISMMCRRRRCPATAVVTAG